MGREYHSRAANEELLRAAVQQTFSAAGALKFLGLRAAGGNYKTLRYYIALLGESTAHWRGQGHLRGQRHNWARKIPLNEILIENSRYRGSTSLLKRRLIEAGMLDEKCAPCKIDTWEGLKLELHLDHMNGKNNDHRLFNLRLLCPNCHSQTITYCGRNKKARLAKS